MCIRRGGLRSPAGEHSSPPTVFRKHPYEKPNNSSSLNVTQTFCRIHVEGERKMIRGKISNRPSSMAKDRTSLEKSE